MHGYLTFAVMMIYVEIANDRQAAAQAIQKNVRQALPFQAIEIIQHKCVSRMAVDRQQTGPAPQRNDVEIPAEAAV